MLSNLHGLWMGMTSYEKALELQDDLYRRCLEDKQSYVLGLEHPGAITLGKRAVEAIDVVWSESELRSRGLQKYFIERGGEATLHSPGQLVIYPILHLPSLQVSVKDYVTSLTTITQKFLKDLGVETQCQSGEPGLFLGERKLVAFGIRIKKGVTQHGLAINNSNDLSLFESIRSCGVSQQKWTRLKDLGVQQHNRALFTGWMDKFRAQFPTAASCEATPP